MGQYKAKTKRKDKRNMIIAIIAIVVVIVVGVTMGIVFSVKPSKKQQAMVDTPSYWAGADTALVKGMSASVKGNEYKVSCKKLTGLKTIATFNIGKDVDKQLNYTFQALGGEVKLLLVQQDTGAATILAEENKTEAYKLFPGTYLVKVAGRDAKFEFEAKVEDIPQEEPDTQDEDTTSDEQ